LIYDGLEDTDRDGFRRVSKGDFENMGFSGMEKVVLEVCARDGSGILLG